MTIGNQADIGRRAAHIESERQIDPEITRDTGNRGDTRRRA